MSKPLFVRTLTSEERQHLEAGRKSPHRLMRQRSQILLASAEGYTPHALARLVGCSDQTVRNTLRAFAAEGLACLVARPKVRKTDRKLVPASQQERVRELLHQSPRAFGKPTSVWTLDLLAEVCFEQGFTAQRVSKYVMRLAVQRLGAHWKRAKRWIRSPDPAYARKKSDENA